MTKKLGTFFGVLLMAAALVLGCGGGGTASTQSASKAEAQMTVKILDVGQGDAILIETGEQTVLVDTSDVDERDKLRAELKECGVTKLDKVVLTHPHADHIGGMDLLLKEFKVGEVYDNGMASTSQIYIRYMKELKAQGISRKGLVAGDTLDLGGSASFRVLFPTAALVKEGKTKGYKHDPNNESIVGELIMGSFKMMFTGDAESPVEKEIIAAGGDLKCQVLKSGHHGSKTSSSEEWLKAVSPEVAVIPCGEGNDYGHPHDQTMKKYRKHSLRIYETDKNGMITITTDGQGYQVTAEKGEAQ